MLFFAMLIMACVFSLVLLFKGDFSKKRTASIEQDQEKPSDRWPAGTPKPQPVLVSRDKAYQPIEEERFIEPVVQIEKDDYGRDVVADEIVIGFRRGTPNTRAQNLEQKYGLILKQYDPALGVAHFKIPAGSPYTRGRLQKIIREREPGVIAAQPNAFVQMLAFPSEIAETGIWYIKNNRDPGSPLVHKQDKNKFYLARLNGTNFIYQCITPDQCVTFPVTENVDISWGAWDGNAPYFQGEFRCSQTDGKPVLAIVDSGFDTLSPDMDTRLDLARAKNVNCDSNESPTAHFDINTHKICYRDSDNPDKEILKDFLDRISNDITVHIHMTHGNAVAQIAIAANGAGTDMVGACLASQDKLIPILMGKLQEDQSNVLDYRFFTTDAMNGVKAAINSGAKVINASWSAQVGPVEKGNWTEGTDGQFYPADVALLRAVEYARENGVLIVAAAGNSATDNDLNPVAPANLSAYFDNVIAVGGIDPLGHLWSGPQTGEGSHYGKESVSLLAAGIRFFFSPLSENFKNALLPAGYPESGLLAPNIKPYVNGTSGSAPIVSAVAAMIYAILQQTFGDPVEAGQIYNYATKIKEIITSTAIFDSRCQGLNNEAVLDYVKHGCLNAAAALDAAIQFAKKPDNLTQLTVLNTTVMEDQILMDSGATGIVAVSEDESGGGGGCGFIVTHGGSGPGGNWPILLIYFIPIFLIVRRRRLLIKVKTNKRK